MQLGTYHNSDRAPLQINGQDFYFRHNQAAQKNVETFGAGTESPDLNLKTYIHLISHSLKSYDRKQIFIQNKTG